ncbi:hypothetical protein CPTAKMssTn_144 [Salmonella phage vB_SenM-AKM_ssTn]|nr:hypothetical protein CPTAKMssTn_144 [Salmonella phage vB_SenM-AKM_ssTn]
MPYFIQRSLKYANRSSLGLTGSTQHVVYRLTYSWDGHFCVQTLRVKRYTQRTSICVAPHLPEIRAVGKTSLTS